MKYKQLVQERVDSAIQGIDSIIKLLEKVQISGDETTQRLIKIKQNLDVANGHLNNEDDAEDIRVQSIQ